ncbi:MAG: hypothetical protein HY243_10555 [Proteobacteria bacterium]|nr:hypothetical protein [Pseudomonadota bacterium]
MRLLIAATAAVLVCSAAIAAPSPMMGSQTMMGSAKTMGVGSMIVHHEVTDYAKWRAVYDADQSNRAAAGLTNCRVHRSMDNANDVVIACNMTDVAKARVFASSKKLMDTMTKAGVMGKPQILFLTPPQ